jgi:dTDP-4-dehydrorhamnose reductase
MYVSELVRIIYQLRDHTGIWHVAAPDSLSKYEFGQNVARIFGFDPHLIEPVSGRGEISRSRDISLNTDKLQGYLRSVGLSEVLTQREGIERSPLDHYLRAGKV